MRMLVYGMVEFGVSLPTGREGLMVPTGFASRESIVGAGALAEELGYDSVWGNDHITVQRYVSHLRPKPSFFEPIVSLAAVSSVTERIRLGTGVLVLPWRTPALVVAAKQIATLDVLSGGRLILGVGAGAYREESEALGVRHNLGRMREGCEAMRLLFEEDPASYSGRFVRFKGVEFYPKPIQRPLPIYLGRHLTTDGALRWLARHGQGWIPGLTPGQFSEAMPRLDGLLREEGRGLEDIDIVREISVSMADGRDEAIGRYMRSPARAHMRSLSEGKSLVGFEEEARWSLIGTSDDVIRGIQGYLDVGVTHFMLNFAVAEPGDLASGMRAFAEGVIPSFK
jgi:probable F420-dependent oxidoreductase